jgi:hypothetical protein
VQYEEPMAWMPKVWDVKAILLMDLPLFYWPTGDSNPFKDLELAQINYF